MRPPPGVSSTSISPSIASTKPCATASPSPTPPSCASVAEPLERLEDALAVRRGHARAAVDDAQVDRSRPTAPASTRTGGAGRRVAERVRRSTLAIARSSRPGSASTRGSVSGTSTSTSRRDGAEAARARRARPRRARRASASTCERAGLQPAHVEQVADEGVEAVGLLVDRLQELAALLRWPVHVVLRGGSSPTP